MPVTVPALSITEAKRLLTLQDSIIKRVPEVASVFGKAGRAETATDPAPVEMFETVINLKPEEQWRPGTTMETLKDELNDALTIPGVANSFTMPIKARVDMLATGIRTPVGIKILGSDLGEMEKIGISLENVLRTVPGTRSVYAERATTGYFLDFDIKREGAARYGLGVEDVQEAVESSIGGMNLTTTVEGRQRYPVNLRYGRDLRNDIEKMKSVLVPVTMGAASADAGMGRLGLRPRPNRLDTAFRARRCTYCARSDPDKERAGTAHVLCVCRLLGPGCGKLCYRGQGEGSHGKNPLRIPPGVERGV